MKNLFETATRMKFRFPYRGMISTEDLWDLSQAQLDSIYKALNKDVKQAQEDSLMCANEVEDAELRAKIDIVKHIFNVKQAEADERKAAAANAPEDLTLLRSSRLDYVPNSNIKKVIFNDPATIILWKDGSKTIVKCMEGEEYDAEKGLAMALCKKYLSDDFRKTFKKYLKEYEEQEKQKLDVALKKCGNAVKKMSDAARELTFELDTSHFNISELLKPGEMTFTATCHRVDANDNIEMSDKDY